MNSCQPRIIGLTGGIATGKSTVSHYLIEQNFCLVYDADVIAREAVAPQSPILENIAQRYGPKILTDTGELNRFKLGTIIFQNSAEKEWLEGLIHPYVRQKFESRIHHYKTSIGITGKPSSPLCLVIPLLFESKMENLVSEVWVITCSEQQQLERLTLRNKLSVSEAQARINSQWPLKEKMKRADFILNNDGDRSQLYAQIDAAIQGEGIKRE